MPRQKAGPGGRGGAEALRKEINPRDRPSPGMGVTEWISKKDGVIIEVRILNEIILIYI
jgi:hypothetical protein